jgi:hypothetical protein
MPILPIHGCSYVNADRRAYVEMTEYLQINARQAAMLEIFRHLMKGLVRSASASQRTEPLLPPLPLRFPKTDLETLNSGQRGISRPFLCLCRHVYILSQMEVEGIQTGCRVIVAKKWERLKNVTMIYYG